jgi:hypothetical protein
VTPQAVLIELLKRLAAVPGDLVLVSDYDLGEWPTDAVAALKTQKLIAKARASASAVCPGCERECVMPVQTVPSSTRSPAAFIVCDKRSDTNRVPVPLDHLTQWRCDAKAVCEFVARATGVRNAIMQTNHAGLWEIGVATGKKRSQMLCLQAGATLTLVAGGNALPLADFIRYGDGAYSLDGVMVGKLVDTATTADPRYTPSTAKREVARHKTQVTYAAWQKECKILKKRHPDKSDVWYSEKIANSSAGCGRNASTIRKHMNS